MNLQKKYCHQCRIGGCYGVKDVKEREYCCWFRKEFIEGNLINETSKGCFEFEDIFKTFNALKSICDEDKLEIHLEDDGRRMKIIFTKGDNYEKDS